MERMGAKGEILNKVETRTKGGARAESTVEGRAIIDEVLRRNKGRDMTEQDKLECKEEDEIEGIDSRRKVSTCWMD